ncbi:hypothetical protein HZC30_02055 [Candidatus Woesearchaeota archaeon]|nr:hypothetical protein [Candidatus Woesearchaeota archaeon]
MPEVIEGEDVTFTDTGAKPDTLETAVSGAAISSTAPAGIKEPISLQDVFTNYLTQMHQYLKANLSILAPRFDLEPVLPYAGFMRFKLEQGGNGEDGLIITVKPLKSEEYISALKLTSPALGALLEGTDLKELLPKDGLDAYNPHLNHSMLASLELELEAGRKSITALHHCSREFMYIPDLGFFSYFLANGVQFKEYLATIEAQSGSPVLFEAKTERLTGGLTQEDTCHNLPTLKELFSPEKVLNYVQQTGNREIRGMMKEYDEERTGITMRINRRTISTGALKYLYGLLKQNNPALILK